MPYKLNNKIMKRPTTSHETVSLINKNFFYLLAVQQVDSISLQKTLMHLHSFLSASPTIPLKM
jgi:hypothetical protein